MTMAVRATDLLYETPGGLYGPPGDFFIDPSRKAARAVITHGHSDHARAGHEKVLATAETLAVMAARLGRRFAVAGQPLAYGETVRVGEVAVSLYPAGHVIGSAQVRLEWRGLKIVVTGDYKRKPDPTTVPFEVVPCDVFVTEATFGLPVYRHPPAEREIAKLILSLETFPERPHLLGAYSLGKAQRLIGEVRAAGFDGPVHVHRAVEPICRLYERFGVDLGPLEPAENLDAEAARGAVVVCPPMAMKDAWAAGFDDPVSVAASGWMQLVTHRLSSGAHLPLVLSDHADWPDLCATIAETGAEEIWIVHTSTGSLRALGHWCSQRGLVAHPPPGVDDVQPALPGLGL